MNKKQFGQAKQLILLALLTLFTGSAWSAIDPVNAQKLLASDGVAQDSFGHTISISGDTAVIGIKRRGVAYVFVRSGDTWSQQAILAPTGDVESTFGSDVAIDGDTIVVGATWGPFPSSMGGGGSPGAAYIFTRSGTTWTQRAQLNASDPENADNFGDSVAIDGDTVLVSATTNDNPNGVGAGSVYVFTGSGASWNQQAKLFASNGTILGRFGISVSLYGDTALIGSQSNAAGSGLAYIFARSGTTWSEQTRLLASANPLAGSACVSLHDQTAVIGDYDRDSVLVFTGSGASWSQQAELTAPDGGLSGFAMSISGDTVLAGGNDNSAYMYTRNGDSWSQPIKMTPSDGITDNGYGSEVAVTADTAMVGAVYNSGYTGAVYAYGPGYTVGGMVSGLATSTSMVLQNNDRDDLTVSTNGPFTFPAAVGSGYPYSVSVLTQPTNPNQVCTVSNGSGTIATSHIDTVTVNCVDMYSIGGETTGLTSGNSVVLQNNDGDDLTISDNGSFTFTALLGDASPYYVTILTQVADPKLTCFLSRASGIVSGANVTDVALDCYPNLDITPSSSGNGTISPPTLVENIPQGSSAQFVLTPIANYMPGPVTGTCPSGSILNNGDGTWTYTTGAITADCSVIANFEPGKPVIDEGDSIGVSMDEDAIPTAFSLTLNASDPNNDTLSWSISRSPDKGTATAEGTGLSKSVNYTPEPDENGSDRFDVQVSDGEYTDTIVVNVTINPINDAPQFIRSTMEFKDGEAEVGQIEVTDIDSEPGDLSFTLTGGLDVLLFSLTNDGILSFKTPPDIDAPGDNDANNRYEITVQVDDGVDITEQEMTVLPGGCVFHITPSSNGATVVYCL